MGTRKNLIESHFFFFFASINSLVVVRPSSQCSSIHENHKVYNSVGTIRYAKIYFFASNEREILSVELQL